MSKINEYLSQTLIFLIFAIRCKPLIFHARIVGSNTINIKKISKLEFVCGGGVSFNIHTHLHCRRETVSVISTDPRCKDQNARLTTVPYPEKLCLI